MKHRDDASALLAAWRRNWQEHGYGYWAVTLSHEPETVIGFGGVMKKRVLPELYDNNLYFRLRPDAWGQGYASELVRAALEAAFLTWSLAHIYGVTRATNTASQRTLERAGFECVGTVDDVPENPPSLLYRLTGQAFVGRPSTFHEV